MDHMMSWPEELLRHMISSVPSLLKSPLVTGFQSRFPPIDWTMANGQMTMGAAIKVERSPWRHPRSDQHRCAIVSEAARFAILDVEFVEPTLASKTCICWPVPSASQ